MGFDTSYHPVDLVTIQGRLVPYVLGVGNIDDLVEACVARAQVRFRANAWGLAAMHSLEPALHVWGRPYLCTGDDPSAELQRWLRATPHEADALGRQMAPAGTVPDSSGSLPEPVDLARLSRWKLDFLRDCATALHQGRTTADLDGEPKDAARMLARESAHALLEFSAQLCPGWMDRGTWPTRLLANSQFTVPRPLLGQLPDRFPQVEFFLHPTLVENFMVGGWLEPEQVGPVLETVRQHREAIIASTDVEPESLQKLIEALHEAQLRGRPFCEATEIYSGLTGIMN